ncbi:hypothetical protein [Jiangella anatolica]|uniref:Uncharacterized protein n=1 Tax=Jiangella anatolica TaxID=2670374 RepID=A0A2W2C3Y8_9ACTN|nr:hypothetical protein [Jiangella anatolica]PZF82959.1 hypothetical protein C1I92_14330 [Jiangella anatolica]
MRGGSATAPSVPPANPMSVELTVLHRRAWWQGDDEHRPEAWEVTADVSELDVCPPGLRRVAELSVTVADLRRERAALDAVVLGDWAPAFLDAVTGDDGGLRAGLEWVSDGPPRVVVVRRYELMPEWRGHGLGPGLLAGALAAFQPQARLAAFRVAPPAGLLSGSWPPSVRPDLGGRHAGAGRPSGGAWSGAGQPGATGLGRAARERVAERLQARRTAVLERLGFRLVDGVHVADLRGAGLADARHGSVDRWARLDWR